MEIKCVAGFAVITKQPAASASLYKEALGLPLERFDDHPDYLFVDNFPGANHFGVWPLKMAAQSCFGQDEWPARVPEPTATVDFELADPAAVEAAVQELKAKGQDFIHGGKDRALGASHRKVHEPRRSAGHLELCTVAT